MSLLVIQIPPKPKLHSREQRGAGGSSDGPTASREVSYVLSPDGRQIAQQGRAVPALLPKADAVVAVVSEGDVAGTPSCFRKHRRPGCERPWWACWKRRCSTSRNRSTSRWVRAPSRAKPAGSRPSTGPG